ncbi:MAG: hypothetical protein KC731_38250 [Myxococcales bacterium]|nr:hypothetical protein [Myxococcales bacterium]
MRLSLRSLMAAALFGLTPLACSIVFDGELGPVACTAEGAFGPPACPEGQTCVSGLCTEIGRPPGSECVVDEDCLEGWRCVDTSEMELQSRKRCSRHCCASTDCGEASSGMVCWAPAGGGALCWPADTLGRSGLGAGRAGEPCGRDEECRSGICDGDHCVDGCCDDTYCRPGDLCRPAAPPLDDELIFACGPPLGPLVSGTCVGDVDCASGRCLLLDGGYRCAEACCDSEHCGIDVDDMGMPTPIGCGIVQGLKSCGPRLPPTALDPVGAPCMDGTTCRSGLCVEPDEGGPSYCSDLCCEDSSCGDPSAFACLPRPFAGSWALRCVRK